MAGPSDASGRAHPGPLRESVPPDEREGEVDRPTPPDDPEADGADSPDETLGDDVPKMG